VFLNDREWPARPTNGAAMIAAAAALQPKHLIIAGFDLFESEAGTYPDGDATPNAYMAMHDRDVEVEIIARALESFAGDTTIVSEPLARRLAARRAAISA
jgi:hypothetical protein